MAAPTKNQTGSLQNIIEAAWDARAGLDATTTGDIREAVEEALAMLDSGAMRIAEKTHAGWITHQWL